MIIFLFQTPELHIPTKECIFTLLCVIDMLKGKKVINMKICAICSTDMYFNIFFSDEMKKIKIPKDMEDAKALGTVLSKYKDTFYTQVLVAYFTTYVLYPLRKLYKYHYCCI